jgi:outer membrane protein OmpA-like peptidoglycan-associated protein
VPNGAIETLVAGARLYAGGSFTSVDPPGAASAEARTYGFGVLSDGELLAAWAPAFAGPVEQLHIAGDFVYAVGEGPQTGAYFGRTPFAVRAATREYGELDNTWSVDFSLGGTAQYGQVFGIAAWTGGLAIGGRMLTGTVSDDGLSLLGVSAVDASITWRSSINGRSRVIALVPRTSSLIVGGTGSLNSSNTFSPPDDLSILDQPTPPATRTTWLPEAPSDVNAVVISGSNLFVGGRSGLLITPVPVDNPNGGGGGSSETPSVTTSTAETITTETQAFGRDTSLTLRPGEVAILLNGTRVPALGTPGVGNRSLVVTGDGTSLTVPSPAGLGGSGAPQWQPGFSTSLNASGFQPGMVVDTYLLSSPQLIGSVSATLTGAGSIAITVPATMKMGSHTLQVVGKDSRGRSLIIAVGLTVEKAPKTMGTRVYFPIGSSKLTKSAKATLRSMINRVKAEGMLSASARVSGLVRPTGTKASDIQLAKKRARTVSAYMKSVGFTGNIQTTTTKAPVGDRWSDRRVHISIKL